MKQHIIGLIEESLRQLKSEKNLDIADGLSVQLERTRDEQHGEFATNVAMVLAKQAGMKPRDLANDIVSHLPASDHIKKVEVAGPGFMNFFLQPGAFLQTVKTIHDQGEAYGRTGQTEPKKILIEFVSANPTGPLHIGHGRGAAYGDAVANLLAAAGHDVVREYYVNDSGRQMDILAISVWLRYLQQCGLEYPYPEKAYQADYVRDIAGELYREHKDTLAVSLDELLTGDWQQLDQEIQLDQLIAFARKNLGQEKYLLLLSAGLTAILQDIQQDLEEFGVTFDNWFSEQTLNRDGLVESCIQRLVDNGDIYEEGGAQWFRSTKYGDEKDRVIERENGQKTYFASDIAYHHNKFSRGFNNIIDVWGADHHGYISRVKGALTALGHDADAMEVFIVQFATLYRGGEKVQMSTRSGQYVTLRDLRQEVGKDAARYFYLSRKSEQHLDFDLDLAKSQSNDNPVYYIQYAHARVCSVMQQMQERGYRYDQASALQHLDCLTEEHEIALVKTLAKFPEILQGAAEKGEPHQIGFYLHDVANVFHSYYNSHQFLVEDDRIRQARIALILAAKQVIRNGLKILGVSAPEKM